MALEELNFEYSVENFKSVPAKVSHYGVVGSGDMEVLMTSLEQGGKATVKIITPVKGFEKVWKLVLEKFIKENELGNVLIEINDNNATPFIVSLRLRQALIEMKGEING